MKNIEQFKKVQLINIFILIIFCFLLVACTKYGGKSSTTTTSGSSSGGSGAGPTPLPPTGSGSGGSGSGGTGSGGTGGGSGSGGTGGGTGSGGTGGGGSSTANIPHAYIQGLFYTSLNSSYVTLNDSISLKQDGSYTTLFAGNTLLKYKIGSGAASDPVYTTAMYFVRPYSYYSYVLFKSPAATVGETLLYNDLSLPTPGTSQVRFISLDPLTTSVPITFRLTNFLDNVTVPNRTYLDNRLDTNFTTFRTINPGVSNVSFVYRDSTLITFSQPFEAGKKYTVFAGALSYFTSSKGTLPVNYYQVARHN